MNAYEELQQELDTAMQAMQGKKTRAVALLVRIAEVLQSRMGFPAGSFRYRKNLSEAMDQTSPHPLNKIYRTQDGAWRITMDIFVDTDTAGNGGKPVPLGTRGRAQCYTSVDLEVKFSDNRIELSFADSDLALELSAMPDTNDAGVIDFCGRIVQKVAEMVRWVATGQGNRERRMGFHL